MYTIDDDIPLPGAKVSTLARVLESMEVGQSVLVDNLNRKDIYVAMKRFSDRSFTSRTVTDPAGFRVWRTK